VLLEENNLLTLHVGDSFPVVLEKYFSLIENFLRFNFSDNPA
jgi:hypothetical protein